MGAFIEVREVAKIYAGRAGARQALRPTSLDVAAGEFVSIVGPSGCGKTTLMKIVAGLLPASAGDVRVGGVLVHEPPDGVGIVFQAATLLKWRTVLENVLVPADATGRPRAQYEPVARALIRLVGLEGFDAHYPRELSGGMQQRVAISRALLLGPRLLLMDEPFGALDAMTREEMNLELQRIWNEQRKTVLFITHSIDEAVFLSDRVVVMTLRPGGVREILDIELPRPRPLQVRAHPRFVEYVGRIRDLIFTKP
jgi:NitT/TauT family transport system ATP-binding protein